MLSCFEHEPLRLKAASVIHCTHWSFKIQGDKNPGKLESPDKIGALICYFSGAQWVMLRSYLLPTFIWWNSQNQHPCKTTNDHKGSIWDTTAKSKKKTIIKAAFQPAVVEQNGFHFFVNKACPVKAASADQLIIWYWTNRSWWKTPVTFDTQV